MPIEEEELDVDQGEDDEEVVSLTINIDPHLIPMETPINQNQRPKIDQNFSVTDVTNLVTLRPNA